LVRAKDKLAPYAVDAWADMAEIIGAESDIVMAARNHANAMRNWQVENGCKVPDK